VYFSSGSLIGNWEVSRETVCPEAVARPGAKIREDNSRAAQTVEYLTLSEVGAWLRCERLNRRTDSRFSVANYLAAASLNSQQESGDKD
jgi:hypothetical protein